MISARQPRSDGRYQVSSLLPPAAVDGDAGAAELDDEDGAAAAPPPAAAAAPRPRSTVGVAPAAAPPTGGGPGLINDAASAAGIARELSRSLNPTIHARLELTYMYCARADKHNRWW